MNLRHARTDALKRRTRQFALEVVLFVRRLPHRYEAEVMGKQLLRAAGSVGANYRAVCRARTRAAFIAKLDIVVEEADECAFWLELLAESGNAALEATRPLRREADELTRIFAAARSTARNRRPPKM